MSRYWQRTTLGVGEYIRDRPKRGFGQSDAIDVGTLTMRGETENAVTDLAAAVGAVAVTSPESSSPTTRGPE